MILEILDFNPKKKNSVYQVVKGVSEPHLLRMVLALHVKRNKVNDDRVCSFSLHGLIIVGYPIIDTTIRLVWIYFLHIRFKELS